MTPRRLPNGSATRRSISRTCLPMRSAVRPAPEHRDDRLDLRLVVDAAGVLECAAALGPVSAGAHANQRWRRVDPNFFGFGAASSSDPLAYVDVGVGPLRKSTSNRDPIVAELDVAGHVPSKRCGVQQYVVVP